VTKPELIDELSARTGLKKKEASLAVNAVLDSITDALRRGDSVQIVGFGTFEVRSREARTGRNPRTGEPIQIPASKAPAFRPGRQLRAALGMPETGA